jgi:hypothetical protein
MGDTGCEPTANLREIQSSDALRSTNVATVRTAAQLDASMTQSESGLFDPALATIIECWPTLPNDVRAAIVAMVEAARQT